MELPLFLPHSIRVILPSGIVEKSETESHLAIKEIIKVELELRNPLRIPLTLTNVSLDYDAEGIPESVSNSRIDKLVLDPHETARITLSLKPVDRCKIKINGLIMDFNGVVPTRKLFNSRGKRLNSTKEQKIGTFYSKAGYWFIVEDFMPLASCIILNDRETLYTGEIVKMNLEISNYGHKDLCHLEMSGDYIKFFSVASTELSILGNDSIQIIDDFLVPNIVESQETVTIVPSNISGELLSSVSPQQRVLVPLHFRADKAGVYNCNFEFRYSSENSAEKRVFSTSITLKVLASMKIKVNAKPSYKCPDAFLASLTMENCLDQNLVIREIFCVSPNWIVPNDGEKIK